MSLEFALVIGTYIGSMAGKARSGRWLTLSGASG
jgi:hypothetical protein